MLVELKKLDGNSLYVNPKYVEAVNPTGYDTCEVCFDGSDGWNVSGTAAEVAAKLNAAEAANER